MKLMWIAWVLGAALVGASHGFAADTANGKTTGKSTRARATTKSPRSTKTTHTRRSTKHAPATQISHATEPGGASTPK